MTSIMLLKQNTAYTYALILPKLKDGSNDILLQQQEISITQIH